MSHHKPTRRSFLQTASSSLAAVAASGSLGALRAATPVHQGQGRLKIGIVGLGGRGSGAAHEALMAHPENVLHAAGDAFADRLEKGLAGITETMAEATVRSTHAGTFILSSTV